jgi:hypothetical protein
LEQRAYNWNNTAVVEQLPSAIEPNAILTSPSEDALFEAADDARNSEQTQKRKNSRKRVRPLVNIGAGS